MSDNLPAPGDKLAFLTTQLAKRATVLHSSVSWYRGRYYVTTMSTVVLSGLITVIAGWKPDLGNGANNVILVLGALSTLVSAWGAFFSPREAWLLYATTLGRLRGLQAKIDFRSRPPGLAAEDVANIDAWFAEYQQVLEDHNKSWLEMRSSSSRSSSALRT